MLEKRQRMLEGSQGIRTVDKMLLLLIFPGYSPSPFSEHKLYSHFEISAFKKMQYFA